MKAKLILTALLCLVVSFGLGGLGGLRADTQPPDSPAAKSPPAKKDEKKKSDVPAGKPAPAAKPEKPEKPKAVPTPPSKPKSATKPEQKPKPATKPTPAPAKPPMKAQPAEPLRSVTVKPAAPSGSVQSRPSASPSPSVSEEKTKEDLAKEALAKAMAERAAALAKELEAAIKAENFREFEIVAKMIETESRSRMMRQQGDEWSSLLRRIIEATPMLQKKYMDFRLEQVAEFTKRVRKACLEGIEVIELERLQIEAIGLTVDNSMFRYQGGSSGPWHLRLKAANSLLGAWIGIQNFVDLGYTEKAVEKIEYFIKSPREFPIVGRKDLDEIIERLQGGVVSPDGKSTEPLEGQVLRVLSEHLKGVKKPSSVLYAEVAAAIAELYPQVSKSGPPFQRDLEELSKAFYGLSRTRDMLDGGNYLQATYDLPAADDVEEFGPGYFRTLRRDLALELVQHQFEELSANLPPNADDTLEDYLFRLLLSEEAKKVPEARVKILKSLSTMGYRGRQLPDGLLKIKQWHETFIKAEKALRVGDLQNALKYYRAVAVNTEDGFGLAEVAESRIAKIKDDAPEALIGYEQKLSNDIKELTNATKAMAVQIAELKKAMEEPK